MKLITMQMENHIDQNNQNENYRSQIYTMQRERSNIATFGMPQFWISNVSVS